jgi:hypothetical protein
VYGGGGVSKKMLPLLRDVLGRICATGESFGDDVRDGLGELHGPIMT